MYTCERCGTRFGRPSAVAENCPRCLARDGVRVGLAFRCLGAAEPAARRGPGGLEAAIRTRMGSTAPELRRIAPAGTPDLGAENRDAA